MMQTEWHLLLQEVSDLDLHCLARPVCSKTKDHFSITKPDNSLDV